MIWKFWFSWGMNSGTPFSFKKIIIKNAKDKFNCPEIKIIKKYLILLVIHVCRKRRWKLAKILISLFQAINKGKKYDELIVDSIQKSKSLSKIPNQLNPFKLYSACKWLQFCIKCLFFGCHWYFNAPGPRIGAVW